MPCAKDVCPECGAPYAPVVEKERVATRPGEDSKLAGMYGVTESGYLDKGGRNVEVGNRDPQRHVTRSTITGYRPTCEHAKADEPARAVILDPFMGAGTVAQVARHFGRDYLGCEINPAYLAIAEARIPETPRCVLRLKKTVKVRKHQNGQKALFT